MGAGFGRRPKLVLYARPKPSMPGTSAADFEVYASYRVWSAGEYFGTLKVVRKTDSRLLFPFDGAEAIGPYARAEDARSAAQRRGDMLVAADIKFPEV